MLIVCYEDFYILLNKYILNTNSQETFIKKEKRLNVFTPLKMPNFFKTLCCIKIIYAEMFFITTFIQRVLKKFTPCFTSVGL